MKRFRQLALAAAVAAAAFASADAHAVFRAYLSSTGNDTGNTTCAITAPCRLMPAALAAVDAGGEIWMLDSANFNTSTVNITKSVTVLAVPGALGSLVGLNGTAVSINGVNIEVALKNVNILSFNGSGDIGVLISNAKSVTIENASIRETQTLTQVVPSLAFPQSESSASVTARVRGVGTQGSNPGLESAVGIFIRHSPSGPPLDFKIA